MNFIHIFLCVHALREGFRSWQAHKQKKEAVTRAGHGPRGENTDKQKAVGLDKCNQGRDSVLLDRSCASRRVTLWAFKKINQADIYIMQGRERKEKKPNRPRTKIWVL